MTVVTIPAGTYVSDHATPKDPAALLAAGSKVSARYLMPGNWKGITPRERDQLHAAGIGIVLILEFGAGDAFKGAPEGTRQGKLAAQWARDLGAPAGVLILGTCDQNTTTATAPIAARFLEAFQAEVEAAGFAYLGGDYIDWEGIDLLPRSRCHWQPAASAWSFRKIHPAAHVIQYPSTSKATRVPGTDGGQVLRYLPGVWLGTPAGPPKPLVGIPQPTVRAVWNWRLKSADENVRHLQRAINFWTAPQRIDDDGKPGPQTGAGIRRLQQKINAHRRARGQRLIVEDGIYGPQTAGAYRDMTVDLDAAGY